MLRSRKHWLIEHKMSHNTCMEGEGQKERGKEREREKEIDRERNRRGEKEKERERERERERENAFIFNSSLLKIYMNIDKDYAKG